MPSPTDFQRLYAVCLLRLPGEPEDAALDRLNSLQVLPAAADFTHPGARRVVKLAYDLARKERSATPRFVAQKLNISEQDLLTWAEQADRDAFSLYAEQLVAQNRARALASAAEDAVKKTRAGDGKEALDELSDQIAALQLASEEDAILTLHEATEQFMEWFNHFQEEVRSGKIRWSFQFETLDEMIPYLFPGHAILITAPSKIGKSSILQQWMDFNIRRGFKGILFHFEDSREVMGVKRTARQMITVKDTLGDIIGLSQKQMLGQALTGPQRDMVTYVNEDILKWKDNGLFVECAGWTMEQCMRVVWRYRDWCDFFAIDYVGKEHFSPSKLRNHSGTYGAAAYDAELIKTTATRLGKIAVVVQQEHEDGSRIYGTKQTWQKFQVWVSLSRHRLENESLSGTYRNSIGQSGRQADGEIVIMSANMGQTGAVPAHFFPEFGLWSA